MVMCAVFSVTFCYWWREREMVVCAAVSVLVCYRVE